jgi:glycerophosphoryl diester phosphodiesterase
MSIMAPAIIAHRGVPSMFPENTLVSLSRAFVAPYFAGGVELDVRVSADEEIYVFHDESTDRLAGVSGSIEERTSDEIAALRVSGEMIPRLSQVLESLLALTPSGVSRLLNVEVKMPSDPARLVELLRPLLDPLMGDDRLNLVVSSFDPRVLAQARGQGADWELGLLYETLDMLACLELFEDSANIGLHPDQRLVSDAHLAQYARDEAGRPTRPVRVWTVDDPHRARDLARLGVDALITNQPARLRRALWSC